MPSVFTRIVQGELPAHKVYETENVLAFLDAFPLRHGHVLVIPKQEIDHFIDLPEALYAEVLMVVKKVSLAVRKVFDCEKVGLSVIGLEVPHAHVHIVPINEMNDLNFNQKKLNLKTEELSEIAMRIRKAL